MTIDANKITRLMGLTIMQASKNFKTLSSTYFVYNISCVPLQVWMDVSSSSQLANKSLLPQEGMGIITSIPLPLELWAKKTQRVGPGFSQN